jgi:2-iminobutanoate/2-iminopropanoate deaminase
MKKTIKEVSNVPKAIGPYSVAVRVNNLLFISGQIPIDPVSGKIIHGDIVIQTRQVLTNIKNILAAEGLDFKNVIKTTIFMTNLDDFSLMNEVYSQFFTSEHPARSTVQVAALPKGANIEIEVIAAYD